MVVMACLLVGTSVASGVGSASQARAAAPVNCTTVYAVQQAGDHAVYSVNLTTGARTTLFTLAGNNAGLTSTTYLNGQAIDPRTGDMYVVSQAADSQTGATIYQIDPVAQSVSVVGTVTWPSPVPTNTGVVMGAMSDTGILYYGYVDTNFRLHVLGFNVDTKRALSGEIGWVQLNDSNGDFTLDAANALWIVTGNQVLRTQAPLSTTGGSGGQLAATTWATKDMSGSFNGVAVGPDGYIYAGSGSATNGDGHIYQINPSQPNLMTMLPSTAGGDFSDLASCSAMNVIKVEKNLPDGRAASGDQFTVGISYNGSSESSATTTGTDTGLQNGSAEVAVLGALPTGAYTVSETAASGASLADYHSTYDCTAMGDDQTGAPGTLTPISGWEVSGTGTTADVKFPSYPSGATDAQYATGIQVTCVFTNSPAHPGITLAKTVAESSFSAVGDVLHYTLTATNSGDVALTDVAITDTHPGVQPDASCADLGTLAPGASASCAATYTVTQADVDAGKVTNAAQVTATTPKGDETGGDDTVTVPADDHSGLTLTKKASVAAVTQAGQVITYTLTATNSGNTTVTDVAVSDPMAGLVPDPSCAHLGTLAPGASASCTATYTVTQSAMDSGTIANTATVTGTSPSGPVSGEGHATVTATQQPALSLVKTVDADTMPAVGQQLTYTFTVTNTGNVSANDVTVTDQMAGLTLNGCGLGTLAPGASASCTGTYTVTQADVDAGKITNVAQVTGTTPKGDKPGGDDTVTVTGEDHSGLTLAKKASVAAVTHAGQVITYTFTATNSGNTTLTDVAVSDPMAGVVLEPSCADLGTLAPGASASCTGTYTVTPAAMDSGTIANTATATGTSPSGPVGGDAHATVTVSQQPGLTLVKTADADTMPAVGQQVTYTFTVTNTGNVSANDVTVTDQMAGLTLNGCNLGTLAAGAHASCTGTYTVTQADVDAGQITNLAKVTGDTPNGDTPGDDDTVTITGDGVPSVHLVKTANVGAVAKAGDTATYTFDVTNTGNVTLSDISVVDMMAGLTLNGCDFATLAPGAHATCTGAYTVTQADLDGGWLTNTATVIAQPPSGPPVNDDSQVTVDLPNSPSMSLVKTVDTTQMTHVGQILTYAFIATNTGNVTLHDAKVTDDALPGIVLHGCDTLGTLAPGASATCTGTYAVTAADLDAGTLTNVAAAQAVPPSTPDNPTPPPIEPTPSNPVHVTDENAVIGDFVWDDLNGNGIQDPGEPGIPGVAVTLVRPNADGTSQTYKTTTDDSGHYTLSVPPSGEEGYTVVFTPPSGMVPTVEGAGTSGTNSVIDSTGTVTGVTGVGGQTNGTVDAGFYTPATVGGVAWNDNAHTGVWEPGDTLAPGVDVTLVGIAGDGTIVSQTVTTDDNGAYHFLVPPSDATGYTVTVTAPDGTVFTDQGKGTNDAVGSDVDASGVAEGIVTTSGSDMSVDAGLAGSNLTVSKTADPASGTPIQVGDTVTYQLTFANPAPAAPAAVDYVDDLSGVVDDAVVMMTGITVTPSSPCQDDAGAIPGTCQLHAAGLNMAVTGDNATIGITGTLRAGTTVVLTYRATVSDELTAGDHSLVNKLTSAQPGGPEIVTTNPVSQLLLTKEGKVQDGESGTEGDTIVYTFTLANVGTTPLHDVELTDPHAGLSPLVFGAWPGDAGVLTPGQSVTATASYVVSDADVLAGQVTNDAHATAVDNHGDNVGCDSSANVPLAANPAISLHKAVSGPVEPVVTAGDKLSYTFTVTNTGDLTLDNVTVTDPMTGLSDIAFTWPGDPGVLKPGQSAVGKASYTVTAADAAAGSVRNTAVATGTIPGWEPGDPVPPSVPTAEVTAKSTATYTGTGAIGAATDEPPMLIGAATGGQVVGDWGLASLAVGMVLAALALARLRRAREGRVMR